MSIATIAAQLLEAAGVSADDILNDAGVDRAGAVKALASKLGVDLSDLVDAPAQKEGSLREVSDEDVAKARAGLEVLARAFA